jgi:uncharacterized protein YyaL (SSP411 family)
MPNRLAKETSPYLQQHADNPVDWYPWGEEALRVAKETGKPILLSVGYSACHWCHVMAHESFEDPEIARVMNDNFVNVKVDREERPDIDQIYQVAQQMLTQRNGGWPLTMFLTPDQHPFFGGTYFPNAPRYGMPGFADLLLRVRRFYDEHPAEIRMQGAQLAAALERVQPRAPEGGAALDAGPIDAAAVQLLESLDREHGGFGGAPKFPHVETIELLLRRFAARGEREALEAATLTLARMARGGIYDQVGGGFARYSVDARWEIPHFEKMLYDNAWLMRAYADAWAITREPLFERVVRESAAWVMREMQSPEGGYYSSLDADSEGEEGKYYVWTPGEVRSVLTPEEHAVASVAFGLDRPANFEGSHWHLVLARQPEGAAQALLESARARLYAAREKRVRPGLDDKVLTSWNALMIAGMARAARVFARPEWLASARRALDFVRGTLWKDGKLLATYRGLPPTGTGSNTGRAHLDAYLDDHAFLLAALIEMMQADFRPADLAWALELGEVLLEAFQDPGEGGFYFTAHAHERLIHRPKPGPDNATPSGNAVAALALNRLAFLTGDMRFAAAAERTLALFMPQVQRHPEAFGTMLAALEEHLVPPRLVIVQGPQEELAPWRALLDAAYLPTSLVLFVPDSAGELPEALRKPRSARVNAWVCEGVTCLPPIESPEGLRATLDLPKMRASPPLPIP